jgi:hypothetical protein
MIGKKNQSQNCSQTVTVNYHTWQASIFQCPTHMAMWHMIYTTVESRIVQSHDETGVPRTSSASGIRLRGKTIFTVQPPNVHLF